MPINKAYIRGTGNVSPQHTTDRTVFSETLVDCTGEYFSCIDPDYREFIDPKLTRRMSRILKMSAAAAKICLNEAGIETPDAIITGTGLGCIQDTIKFMDNLLEGEEKLLNPAPFIQSTHNTVSGQLALMLKCCGYNNTYTHRGFSFETAVTDAMMLLREGKAGNVLAGAADEITPASYTIMKRLGYRKKHPCTSGEFMFSGTEGTIAGEGAAFFLLTGKKNERCTSCIETADMLYKPGSPEEIHRFIGMALESCETNIADIDIVVLGRNGDNRFDHIYDNLEKNVFARNNRMYYKNLCGEYHTSTAFALWLADDILRRNHVPENLLRTEANISPVKKILIYNHLKNINHSLFLVSGC